MKHPILHLVPNEPIEDDEAVQEEEDLFRPPAKFFAEPSDNIVAESRIEGGRLFVKFYADALPTETDERVSKRVSEMLSKNEGKLGPKYGDPFTGRIAAGYLAARTEQPPPELPEPAPKPVERFLPVVSAPAKTFVAPRHVEEKTDMTTTEKDLTETQCAVLAAYRAGTRELGRPPSNVELQEALPPYSSYAINAARKVLVDLGLAAKPKKGGQGRRADASDTKEKVAPKAKTKKSRAVVAPESAAPANEDPIVRVIREEAAKSRSRSESLERMLAAYGGQS